MTLDQQNTQLAIGQLLALETLARSTDHLPKSFAAQKKLSAALELIREAIELEKRGGQS